MLPTLLLTRPRAASDRFLAALREAWDGPAVISPVLEIRPCGGAVDLSGIAAVVFTSANAVEVAAARSGERPPAFCVGPWTEAAAAAAGFPARAGGGDAEALLKTLLAARPTGPLLHLRGRHATGRLADRLRGEGLHATGQVVYDQAATPPTPEALALLGGAGPVVGGAGPVVLPLFSPRSAALAGAAVADAGAPLFLAAMSDAVAAAWRGPAPAALAVAGAPTAEAMRGVTLDLLRRAAVS